jgi:hypothetical protein
MEVANTLAYYLTAKVKCFTGQAPDNVKLINYICFILRLLLTQKNDNYKLACFR